LRPEPPSGRQFEIRHGTQRAVITEVGATLREYEVDGHAVLDGFAVDKMADGGRGQPLLPWPNRLEDGQYTFGGRTLQLPIDEVERHNANHGLTRWLNWTAIELTRSKAALELNLHPRPGYPFTLQLRLEYALADDGLTVRTRAENHGAEPLPFGAGQHPYFTVGAAFINDTLLKIPAGKGLEMDNTRRLPTGRVLDLHGSALDFRTPKAIGDLVVDDCFAELERDADGRSRVGLSAKYSISIWLDVHYKYVQIFSGDTLPADRRRHGLAVEPMTCPPNAFRSNVDLIVLPPAGGVDLEWGIQTQFDNQLMGL
jgi:aldose 1-epimerase